MKKILRMMIGVGCATLLLSGSHSTLIFGATLVSGQDAPPSSNDDLLETSITDHQATLKSVRGNVYIVRKNTQKQLIANSGDVVYEGDQVLTLKNSAADIVYDDFYLNYIELDESTNITFESIEPTKIDLQTGSLFNSLEGLLKNESYEVSTPTSISGVRGTQFTRFYNSETEEDETDVLDGSVDFYFKDDAGLPILEASHRITANETIRFKKSEVRSMGLGHIAPTKVSDEKRNRFLAKRKQIEKKRYELAGGFKNAAKLEAKFHEIKKNPERQDRLLKARNTAAKDHLFDKRKNSIGHKMRREDQPSNQEKTAGHKDTINKANQSKKNMTQNRSGYERSGRREDRLKDSSKRKQVNSNRMIKQPNQRPSKQGAMQLNQRKKQNQNTPKPRNAAPPKKN